MQLGDLFDLSLIGRRSVVALECDDAQGTTCTYTFGDIDERANRMAQALAARGLKRGDRLCVHLANRLEFLDLFLACVRTGIIFVPVNVLYRQQETGHIIADAAPALSITTAQHLSLFGTGPALEIEDVAAEASRQSAESTRVPIDGDDPLGIVYTSGTTGRSKG